MNLTATLRAAALAATLFVLPCALTAKGPAPADRAAQLLAVYGRVPVSAAGPYVERGTFQIQVSAKLGQPSARLPDGTWLYKNFSVDESIATGTLIVHFSREGRVSDLSLATPAVIAALRAPPKPADASGLVASQASR